jgi:GNAT superfamily N-acetyltransferase
VAVEVERAPIEFCDWNVLLSLLHAAFAYQSDRIDPPSSVFALDAESIALKARNEQLFLAVDGAELVGCVFAKPQTRSFYVGKLAVLPHRQRQGIARRLMQATEESARELGLLALELDTRIELTENHQTFEALGFVKTAEGAHEGFHRITFITMRKPLATRETETPLCEGRK